MKKKLYTCVEYFSLCYGTYEKVILVGSHVWSILNLFLCGSHIYISLVLKMLLCVSCRSDHICDAGSMRVFIK